MVFVIVIKSVLKSITIFIRRYFAYLFQWELYHYWQTGKVSGCTCYKDTTALLLVRVQAAQEHPAIMTPSCSCFHKIIKSLKRHWEGTAEGLLVETPGQSRTVTTARSALAGFNWVVKIWFADLTVSVSNPLQGNATRPTLLLLLWFWFGLVLVFFYCFTYSAWRTGIPEHQLKEGKPL